MNGVGRSLTSIPGREVDKGTANHPRRPSLTFDDILHITPGMADCVATARKLARSNSTILITGETGVGKEILTQAIHEASERRDKPFVARNCGAFPANMLESELCGHVKGGFTGAERSRDGAFRTADGGTIFLDEIGELTPAAQVALLRVLQEREVQPVGSDRYYPVNVRVVAATNVNLEQAVQEKRFRIDLFYRLNVVPIHIPPLRERQQDILSAAYYFFQDLTKDASISIAGFTSQAEEWLEAQSWPGNLRELRNAVERGVALCEGKYVGTQDMSIEKSDGHKLIKPGGYKNDTIHQGASDKLADLIEAHVQAILEETDGNRTKAAARLGISRRQFSYYLDVRAKRESSSVFLFGVHGDEPEQMAAKVSVVETPILTSRNCSPTPGSVAALTEFSAAKSEVCLVEQGDFIFGEWIDWDLLNTAYAEFGGGLTATAQWMHMDAGRVHRLLAVSPETVVNLQNPHFHISFIDKENSWKSRQQIEWEMARAMFELTSQGKSRAAHLLGVSLTTMQRYIDMTPDMMSDDISQNKDSQFAMRVMRAGGYCMPIWEARRQMTLAAIRYAEGDKQLARTLLGMSPTNMKELIDAPVENGGSNPAFRIQYRNAEGLLRQKKEIQLDMLQAALIYTDYNTSHASGLLGVDRTEIVKKCHSGVLGEVGKAALSQEQRPRRTVWRSVWKKASVG
ncbi:MAG: sigma 54-interacting transcriptional regulator [Alphaproteobacteria bacterium]|nr:sigma 54-interacting transcriptional regulator [Alphaproteobacteria bacterium]